MWKCLNLYTLCKGNCTKFELLRGKLFASREFRSRTIYKTTYLTTLDITETVVMKLNDYLSVHQTSTTFQSGGGFSNFLLYSSNIWLLVHNNT